MKFTQRCRENKLTPRQSACVLAVLCPTAHIDARMMQVEGLNVDALDVATDYADTITLEQFLFALADAKKQHPEAFVC